MDNNRYQESQLEEGTEDQDNRESQLNNQQSAGRQYFEGESLAEEYVDQLIQNVHYPQSQYFQGEQAYAQQTQQCSIGRNSDELFDESSQKEEHEIHDLGNDLKKDSHIHTEDSQQ